MPTRRRVARSLAASLAAPGLGAAHAAAPGFEPFARFSGASPGEQLVSPFGIPFPFGRIASTERARIAARYPAGPGGRLLPLQLEQFKLRRDGTLVHCTGHMRLPAGYVARTPVEIGLAAEGEVPRPAPPDWDALWRAPLDFAVTLSTWEPRAPAERRDLLAQDVEDMVLVLARERRVERQGDRALAPGMACREVARRVAVSPAVVGESRHGAVVDRDADARGVERGDRRVAHGRRHVDRKVWRAERVPGLAAGMRIGRPARPRS